MTDYEYLRDSVEKTIEMARTYEWDYWEIRMQLRSNLYEARIINERIKADERKNEESAKAGANDIRYPLRNEGVGT